MKKKNKIRLKNLSIQVMAILVINGLVILSFLQLSSVQTYFGRMLAKSISNKTGYTVTIEKVDIVWLDKLHIEKVKINDLSSSNLIEIENLEVNYNVAALMGDHRIAIDHILFNQPTVNLRLDTDQPLNITAFITSLKKAYNTSKKGKSKPVLISSIIINNGTFTYNYLSRDSLQNRFDYNHFGFDSINLQVNHLTVVADTINLQMKRFNALETSTGLPIKSFTTQFEVSNSRLQFNNLKLHLGNSNIQNSMTFSYSKMADLGDFIAKVRINADFSTLKLTTSDLHFFAPSFTYITDTLHFTGKIKGKITDFTTSKFQLRFGKSKLEGNAYFQGLPDIFNTFIDAKIKKSNVYKSDLARYISSPNFEAYYPIDSANVKGSFTGYPKDFVAKASFYTSIGYAHTDINLKLNADHTKSKYSGNVELIDFDLGKLTKSTSMLGQASLSGEIRGTGMTKSSADFELKSTIDRIDINDYVYTNIETNAHFSQELFDGNLEINDPNLQFKTSGIIDLRNNINLIKLEAVLAIAQLDKLNIRQDSSTISGRFNVNVKGISLDSITGKIDITNLKATNKGNSYQVNNLELLSEVKNNERVLVLFSERVRVQLIGNFNLTSAVKDLTNVWKEHTLKIRNRSSELEQFYLESNNSKHNSSINFNIDLYDINPLLNLFDPLVHLSSNSNITGNFSTGNNSNFEINFSNDTIIYDHNLLLNNKLAFKTTTNLEKTQFLGKLDFSSNSQILRSGAILDSLSFNTNWKNDSLNFQFRIEQQTEHNINHIQGLFQFKKDTTLLSIYKSQIQVLNQTWQFNQDNLITFTRDKLLLSNMSLTSGNQSIFASGSIAKNSEDPILIRAIDVEMENLNPLIPNHLQGLLNGSASVSNIFTTPLIETKIRIDSFQVDDTYFGNIDGLSSWNQSEQLFDVRFFVERNERKLVNIIGTYKPLGDDNALHLNAKLIGTELKLAEPFTKDLFNSLEGTLSGDITITGALFAPKLKGGGNITDAALTIDYLNTRLKASGNWALDSGLIGLNNIKITDKNLGSGNLKASFNHNNFKSFTMDLEADFTQLNLLNTISKDNDYFYGTAIGSGAVSIKGPLGNLVIETRAKTEKGTKLYIPLTSNNSGAKQEDFISFSNFTKEEKKPAIVLEDKINLKNLTINLDLEITPEAYAEIIFDLAAGDIIRGNGKGNLSLGIDTKGKFTMLGDYEFTNGAYNFTMYNIVNKEFKINPKSKITWSGDPYLAKMDINADYKVNTSLAPIMDTVYQDLPEVKRIYPSKVLLELDGALLSPDIQFDIKIEDYPKSNVNIDTEVRAFLNKIHNDEQEMNRQVFSLLVFRKYSPPNSFSTGGTVGSSVSEFVSNQLSYWISQVDENLTIDFDLGNLDENALETFQLRVSYAFMDGKLIVTRDGGFTDQNQNTTLSSITGDWTVEYLLSEDGKLRIKLFKRTNYDQLTSSSGSNDELISGGFSLLFTTSFDSIKELFNNKKNNKSKKEKNSPTDNEAIKPEDDENTP